MFVCVLPIYSPNLIENFLLSLPRDTRFKGRTSTLNSIKSFSVSLASIILCHFITVIRLKKIAPKKIMGLGPTTAAMEEKVCDMFKVVSMRRNLRFIFYIISMNFRFEFDGFFHRVFLVNNTKESLKKRAQEVSIKRLINVKEKIKKTWQLIIFVFTPKECYRNSFMEKNALNVLRGNEREKRITFLAFTTEKNSLPFLYCSFIMHMGF